ncbi:MULTISPECIES: FAD-dependent monooxygenase [unclassified Streptomyces]|uniref:FAD-dependent monooxygenase n=1 Tax=unclassified Streptomyces TaxID=2593676 RepID=UPI00166053DA|nr:MULTISPECIES: FAD-dependent monooxygenase [unclassified Streptomyces]MBD0710919.1 3-hydroxybenzoate 6-hydroxylase [Streptomyces sp. CBMA291]MBD0717338.1 3-hydroxybenzoate 6-hydroxylase [Streptomyces sp. CBMA370]
MNPASTPSGRPDVLVVGGGIGGLGAAFALARQGLRVRVLEQAPAYGEVGAGLQLAPNCTRILAEYGLLDEAVSLGVVPENMVMRDAVDARVLTRLDLRDLERRYGFPYLVIHRSDLHGILLRACERAGVDLLNDRIVTGYENTDDGALVRLADGGVESAPLVVAADGLHSVARRDLIGDDVVNSSYVAYRSAVPIDHVAENGIAEKDVTVYVGPRCHFVQYALRGGDMFNQVAVFESPKALAGQEDWGTPDELDTAFEGTCDTVRKGIPLMWRDRWWRMFDREPIEKWVHGRIALLGDAAHPPLQYMAQGAIMAIEDGWVLARHYAGAAEPDATPDRDAALAAYEAVRVEHCRRVQTTARSWGALWHLEGDDRLRRNTILRARDEHDYSFTDWVYGPTALAPDEEPAMFTPVPLSSAPVGEPAA